MPKYLAFLTSNRFHALVVMALAYYLKTYGFVVDATGIAVFLEMICGGHIVLKTTDDFAKNIKK